MYCVAEFSIPESRSVGNQPEKAPFTSDSVENAVRMNIISSNRLLMGLFQQRELSQDGARKFVDVVQTSRLSAVQLSTTLEIRARQKTGANCLSIEAIEYRYLLSGGVNGVVTLYDLETVTTSKGVSIVQPLLENVGDGAARLAMISCVQWYPEDTGAFIASSMNGSTSIYDTNRFVPVASFAFPANVVHAARIGNTPNTGISIAVALQDGTVHLCDPRTRDSSHVFKGHGRAATCVAWDPIAGSHLLASAGMDGAVRVWDVRKAGGVKDAAVRSLDWRGDFTSSARVNTSKLNTSLLPAHSAHRNGGVLHIREGYQHFDSSVNSNSTSNASSVGKAHDSAVMSLRYTSCGNYLVTSGNDQKVRLWGAHTGQLSPTNFSDKVVPVSQLPYDIGIAEFSYAASDVLIVPTGANSSAGEGSQGPGGTQQTGDGDILLIPLHSSDGKPVRVLRGHLDRVTAIAYRRPQQQIVSAGKDGMIFVWGPPDHKQPQNNSNKQRSSAEEGRQQRLFYGTTGGRYDYQQVLDAFGSAASSTSTTGGAVPAQTRPQALRVLPRNEQDRVSSSEGGPSIVKQTTPSAPASSAPPLSDDSSADDWSEDEPEPPEPSTADAQSAARSNKRKASSIIQQASAGSSSMSSAGENAVNGALNKYRSGEELAHERRSRSFVPPIIQHYLQDAQRSTQPQPIRSGGTSSCSAPSHARVAATAGDQRTSGAASNWQDVETIFTAAPSAIAAAPTVPHLAHAATLTSLGNASSSSAVGRAATAPAGSAGSDSAGARGGDARDADKRYAQWLKQVRNKGSASKSSKK